jgi:putative transposase
MWSGFVDGVASDHGLGVTHRLDQAFAGFYRRLKAGLRAGYPRFKSEHRWDSVSWPDRSGWKLDQKVRQLHLKGVGSIPLRTRHP